MSKEAPTPRPKCSHPIRKSNFPDMAILVAHFGVCRLNQISWSSGTECSWFQPVLLLVQLGARWFASEAGKSRPHTHTLGPSVARSLRKPCCSQHPLFDPRLVPVSDGFVNKYLQHDIYCVWQNIISSKNQNFKINSFILFSLG